MKYIPKVDPNIVLILTLIIQSETVSSDEF